MMIIIFQLPWFQMYVSYAYEKEQGRKKQNPTNKKGEETNRALRISVVLDILDFLFCFFFTSSTKSSMYSTWH